MKDIREIKEKLRFWGIKQQWLADKLEVNKATLSLWLTGTYEMPQEKINEAKKYMDRLPMPE